MTREEFETLNPGDIIEGTNCGKYEIIERDLDCLGYKVRNVKYGTHGVAYIYENWTLVRRSKTKIIRLGGKYEDKR